MQVITSWHAKKDYTIYYVNIMVVFKKAEVADPVKSREGVEIILYHIPGAYTGVVILLIYSNLFLINHINPRKEFP